MNPGDLGHLSPSSSPGERHPDLYMTKNLGSTKVEQESLAGPIFDMHGQKRSVQHSSPRLPPCIHSVLHQLLRCHSRLSLINIRARIGFSYEAVNVHWVLSARRLAAATSHESAERRRLRFHHGLLARW